MLVSLDFLTHYHGNSKTDKKIKERITWATTEIDIPVISHDDLHPVFQYGEPAKGIDLQRAFEFDGGYWVVAEAVARRGYMRHEDIRAKDTGLRNFTRDITRKLSWDTFEFTFLTRAPGAGVDSVGFDNIRQYKPADEIKWDDTESIADRTAHFWKRRLLIAGGLVHCKIDPPVLMDASWFHGLEPVFTPYGGFGAPLLDYEIAEADLENLIKTGYWNYVRHTCSFTPISAAEIDTLQRTIRAIYLNTFRRNTILLDKSELRKKKASKDILRKLEELWTRTRTAINTDVLDEAVDYLLAISPRDSQAGTRSHSVTTLLRSWQEREIPLPPDFPT